MSLKTVTVLYDSQEQRPLLFPDTLALWKLRGAGHKPKARIIKVKTEKRTLGAGDYCLLGGETLAIVERKADIGELIMNTLTADRPRFLRALERLAAGCTFPYLYVERLPPLWWRGGETVCPLNVVQAMDLLLFDITRLGIRLLWGNNAAHLPSSRRRMGELILRILLAHQETSNEHQNNCMVETPTRARAREKDSLAPA